MVFITFPSPKLTFLFLGILLLRAGKSREKSTENKNVHVFHFFEIFHPFDRFHEAYTVFIFLENINVAFFSFDHHAICLIPFSHDIGTYECIIPFRLIIRRSRDRLQGVLNPYPSRRPLLFSFHISAPSRAGWEPR